MNIDTTPRPLVIMWDGSGEYAIGPRDGITSMRQSGWYFIDDAWNEAEAAAIVDDHRDGMAFWSMLSS
jgi:hypothetical protein